MNFNCSIGHAAFLIFSDWKYAVSLPFVFCFQRTVSFFRFSGFLLVSCVSGFFIGNFFFSWKFTITKIAFIATMCFIFLAFGFRISYDHVLIFFDAFLPLLLFLGFFFIAYVQIRLDQHILLLAETVALILLIFSDL